ncbi:MAG TPA: hypothetical protein VIK45_04510 [Candidatus Dormibacteraeota bacterium]
MRRDHPALSTASPPLGQGEDEGVGRRHRQPARVNSARSYWVVGKDGMGCASQPVRLRLQCSWDRQAAVGRSPQTQSRRQSLFPPGG